MASVDRTYVDPSALRGLYVHEQRSRAFALWRRRVRGALLLTAHGRLELVNSVELARFRGDLSTESAAQALADLADDLTTGRLVLTDLPWRRTLDRAVELSERYSAALGTRTLDVLHVASALTLEMRAFVTYDRRQAALARSVRLRVTAP